MTALSYITQFRLRPEQVFMLGGLVVNLGNYGYNLVLGRYLGPAQFADAAVMITMLLVLSFLAMTFQLGVAKFTVELDTAQRASLIQVVYGWALLIGCIAGGAMVLLAPQIQQLLHTDSKWMFIIFGCSIPLYFMMSVNRGIHQGEGRFIALSATYQLEMFTRLLVTLLIIILIPGNAAVGVAVGIAVSLVAGIFPFRKIRVSKLRTLQPLGKKVITFFILTAFYEGTLVICNNSDLLLVKRYFDAHAAGLYASLALIGRVVYYVTWMFIMLLLPKVVERQKRKENTLALLRMYLGYITVFCIGVVAFTFIFPELAVKILFGEDYLAIAPLLGWYATATGLFAISNVFAYYFLSLGKYLPVLFASVMGIAQIVLIIFYHSDLFEVVLMQILAMAILLALQIAYFTISLNKKAV